MYIKNEIYNTCYNYEGFELDTYGIDFYGHRIEMNKVKNNDIRELEAKIVAYNPLQNKNVIILRSSDFIEEIKSYKLINLLMEQIYEHIVSAYLLKAEKKDNSYISLKRIVEELKEEFIIQDNKEYNKMEKEFYKEYSDLRFLNDEEYNQIEKEFRGENFNNNKCVKTMDIDSFLNCCRYNFKMNDRDFLYFCVLDKELSPCKRLWLKILCNIYPYIKLKVEN